MSIIGTSSAPEARRDVVFWLPAVNPYWHARFVALQKSQCVSFECWFASHVDPKREWVVDETSMIYPHVFLSDLSVGRRLIFLLTRYLKIRPRRVFTFHYDRRLWGAWLHRLIGGHLALYTLKSWDSWVQRSRLKEFVKARMFSNANSVLTPGPDSDDWAKSYGAKSVHRLHHAVDVESLQKAVEWRERSSTVRLLVVSRLVPEKGSRFLLELIERALRAELNVRFIIVGGGSDIAFFKELHERYPECVDVIGFVQSSEMPAMYASADILLFPTLGDPYGLVVDEAMAAGLPVVSSEFAGDISWRLRDGRGWVLPLEVPVWLNHLRNLDVDAITSSSRKCREFSQGHDLDRWVGEIEDWIHVTD